ncbi:amidohydrolase family protein [Phenylobacterium immobile]|uniref:amidohydrolase family protein n=1 Tax=Phenylobacterium immobile TaxID=21 RepID=UPI000ADDEEB0|nr:amidohydrolase family protein [Phenylobacterium immobile]
MTGSNKGVDRRKLLSLGGTAAVASAMLPAVGMAQSPAPTAAEGHVPLAAGPVYVTAYEGTNICIAPSPDERTIVFDLYGILWTLPISGGVARRLTDEFADAALPEWTPDGKTIVFQSYRSGNFHIWRMNPDGSGIAQLTTGAFDCREPRVSPDGSKVAFSSDRSGSYAIHVLDLSTGAVSPWSNGKGQACQPAWSPDGARIVYAVDRTRIEVCAKGQPPTVLANLADNPDFMNATLAQSPCFDPKGGLVFHVVENGKTEYRGSDGALFAGEDLFPFQPRWLKSGDMLYTADGQIRRRAGGKVTKIPFAAQNPVTRPSYPKARKDFDSATPKPVIGIGSPALSPDGRQIAFRSLNALYLLPVGGRAKAIVDDGFWVCDPAWSPDGQTLAYSTDRGGKLDIWLRDLATGAERQLTHGADAALSAAWSKDGAQIAFLDQQGGLFRVDVATGATTRVFQSLWEPGKPSWSADGKTIAYAAFKPYSARFREGLSEILTVDVATGVATYQPVFPDRSLGTRGDDGPVWTVDGTKMVFVFASRLHVVAVDATGKFMGAPVAINNEVSDAPTFSADGKQVLYLSAGKLRLIPTTGGAPRTVAHGLTWANVRPKGRLVLRAGGLWEGLGPDVKRNVDVIVEGARIAEIVPAGSVKVADAKLIDAADATVIPGMVEIHAHRQMAGYAYGDRDGRLWLSLGVTTTRSPGSPAYHMVEDREALDSGRRVGPRYWSTGEAIDGNRIFYNFMRPVSEPGQMALELERAAALSYDLMKSYVRLPLAAQKELIDWAHAHGLPVTGHYHYPAMSFGQDGMEHIGATSRLGYSRTVTATGHSYQDVAAVFVQSGARRTPTLFQSSAMYGEDRSLVDDARIKALYPPWEYARLSARAEALAKSDNSVTMAFLERNVQHLMAILRNGGRVTAGTDSPIDFNAISHHMNLRAMVRYGMTPYEALLTATRFSGEFLDAPLGVIAPGMLADLVVCNADPLVDIAAAADVRMVVKNGEALDMPAILGPFGAAKQAYAPVPEPQAQESAGLWWHQASWVEASRTACCLDADCLRAGDLSGLASRFQCVEI